MLKKILFFLLFIAFSLSVFANPEDKLPSYSEYLSYLTILSASTNNEELVKAKDFLLKIPTYEVYETAVYKIEAFLDNREQDPSHNEVEKTANLMVFVTILMELGSAGDAPLISELLSWLDSMDFEYQGRLSDALIATEGALMEKTSGPALRSFKFLDGGPNTLRVGADKGVSHRGVLSEVDAFLNKLKERIKGQDDILESLQLLYLRDRMNNGVRSNPEIFYLMGLPGNGKDTIAEGYVDSLHGKKDAYLDHMFRLNIRNKAEAWSYFGSGKGYIGSEEMPEFLRFLVSHSGGKYILRSPGKNAKGQDLPEVIEINPNFESSILPISTPPNKAVIFVNEAHNIPKEVKDNLLKQAIEKGIFPITNPGGTPNSVSEIILPVTFIWATNEGISLLEPRQKNGARLGAPLSYEELLANYNRVKDDKDALKAAILSANGEVNNPNRAEAEGTSEEFLNRIPAHRLHILKPLSQEILLKITQMGFERRAELLRNLRGPLGSYDLSVDQEVLDFVVEYRYIASDNARPINSRLNSFIFDQIDWAIKSRRIKPLGTKQSVHLSLNRYQNGVVGLKFYVTNSKNESYQFTRLISETLSDKTLRPISAERVSEIVQMRDVINANVAGVEHIASQLVEAAVVSEAESRNSGVSVRPATVMAFLGKTSTGKTETAKQFVKARYGEEAELNVIDFNGVRSLSAFEAKVLGSFDDRLNPIASEFMKAYDRALEGRITFIFDEAANSPKELLKGLYEILREPIVTGFSDGKPRSMKNVTIIITGNAGENIYKSIPVDLSPDVYEKALHEVFRLFLSNEALQKRILQETFPEALLARLGKNIFHFGPLTNSGKRQVVQIKLLRGIENLRPKASERGWNILFSSELDLLNLFEMIEQEGFDYDYQGASIDQFVRESIIDKIKATLLIAGVASGSDVTLEVEERPVTKEQNLVSLNYRRIKLYTDASRESFLEIEIPVGLKRKIISERETDRVLVAYHEVGHEIVSEVYFGDQRRPKYLSIIEGVSIINGELVHYAGIRQGDENEKSPYTKEFILRNAAVLAGGYVAQRLVTLGARHDAGKSNDLHRSTQIIQAAILRYGLSEEWGLRSIPAGMTTADFIQQELSDEEKQSLNRITDKWLSEARLLAREALMANSEKLFIEMSRALAEKGDLNKDEIEGLYTEHGITTERDGEAFTVKRGEIKYVVDQINSALDGNASLFSARFTESNFDISKAEEAYKYLMQISMGRVYSFFTAKRKWNSLSSFQKFIAAMYLAGRVGETSRDAKLSSDIWLPTKVANIVELLNLSRANEVSAVTRLESFEFFPLNNEASVQSYSQMSCKSILAGI